MTRTRMILLAGIALLSTLALVESATRSDAVLPATVAAITSAQATEGPDTWTLEVTLADGTSAQIDYAGIRPNRTIGDSLCVIEKKQQLGGCEIPRLLTDHLLILGDQAATGGPKICLAR